MRFTLDDPSFVGAGFDFLERGDALLDLEQARLAQVAHAFLLRLSAMSSAVPLRMMSWRISSVIGITS
jgi:hypothetical protein